MVKYEENYRLNIKYLLVVCFTVLPINFVDRQFGKATQLFGNELLPNFVGLKQISLLCNKVTRCFAYQRS